MSHDDDDSTTKVFESTFSEILGREREVSGTNRTSMEVYHDFG